MDGHREKERHKQVDEYKVRETGRQKEGEREGEREADRRSEEGKDRRRETDGEKKGETDRWREKRRSLLFSLRERQTKKERRRETGRGKEKRKRKTHSHSIACFQLPTPEAGRFSRFLSKAENPLESFKIYSYLNENSNTNPFKNKTVQIFTLKT